MAPAPIASAELIAIGSELVVGETRDTNGGDLAAELTSLGVEVRRISQLPDVLEVVVDALRSALAGADLVITTGGLGPTPDDLTREAIAEVLGEEPAVDPELEAWLRGLWAKRGLPFSTVNLKQAWLIPSAAALPNPHGTAPGWLVRAPGDRLVAALPGPPREMWPMWRERALPLLRERGLGADRASETLRLTGIGESAVVDLIGEAILRAPSPQVATYARLDAVDVRISATGDGSRGARDIVDEMVARLAPRLAPYLFARGEEGWPEALDRRLRGRRLATVEVGTAGQLGALLGASPWLVLAEELGPATPGVPDLVALTRALRRRAGADVALGAWARQRAEDMTVEVAVDIGGHVSEASHAVFRGGDIGRRRAANAACAELWARLGDEPAASRTARRSGRASGDARPRGRG